MKATWMGSLLAAAGLLVALAAYAAETAKQASPARPGDAPLAAEAGGADDWFADGDEGGDLFAPGGVGFGMGMGAGHGAGMGHGPGMGGPMRCDGACGMSHGRGRGRGAGAGWGGAFAALDLSDAQREKLAAVHARQARKNVQARADLQLARMDLHELMRAESPNTAAINVQIDRLAKLQAEMRKGHVAAFLEARALLTPEQQKQLRERHAGGPGAGRRPGMGRGPHGGMGGPPGDAK